MAKKRRPKSSREPRSKRLAQPVRESESQNLPQPVGQIAARHGSPMPPGYAELLEDLKDRIRHAQLRAAGAANRELIRLYWDIGRAIVERQRIEGWGKAVVARLATDLQREFPGVGGFSPQNVWYMRAFYLAWTEDVAKLQQSVGELESGNLPQLAAELDGTEKGTSLILVEWEGPERHGGVGLASRQCLHS